MPYKCAFGCTHYNPCCDACESATTDNSGSYAESPEQRKQKERTMIKAANHGMTYHEWIEQEEEE